ncbi:MAG: pyridoxamine 5'-phosphate oxidase family protein [Lachnospiraceae bacterium]|nr:pyridoxamine 5'-phosphate oxidase family protein [Lachnospiraceae bacterium]
MSLKTEAFQYLKNAKNAKLVTANSEGAPDIRTVGGYSADDQAIYILTNENTNKVAQIRENDKVLVFAENEGQIIPDFVNFTFYGRASLLSGEEYRTAEALIKERRPQLDFSRPGTAIIKVEPHTIKKLDFSADEKITFS